MERTSRGAPIATGLAIAALGGASCAWIGTPLPWMIGAMLAVALARMAGIRVAETPGGRAAGFVVVGLTLGLYFTSPVVAEVAARWPWFLALGVAAHGLGMLSALVLKRLSGVSWATAYFGSMPAGGSEMAHIGERYGVAADRVAFAHSFRMMLVVTLFPIGMTLAGFSSTEEYRAVRVPFDAGGLALLLAIGTAAGFAARRFNVPTAFMIGPLFAAIALTANGIDLSSMPAPLVNAAQVLLGMVLGVRFDRSFLAAAPRFAAALVPSVAITLGLATVVGWLLARGSGVHIGTGLLAAAPGGIAEMSITARVLQIGVAYVTAAHVIRYLVVVLLTVPVYRLLARADRGSGGI